MFEDLTPRANKIIHILAQEEAKRLNHDQLSPEHILLGLIRDGDGIAVKALVNLGINLSQLREELESAIRKNDNNLLIGEIPTSPRVDKILKLSSLEARNLSHTYIGTEHLLLGILKEENGTAALILESKSLNVEKIRNEILRLLGHAGSIRTKNKNHVKTPNLDEFGRDLMVLSYKKELDPVIGRKKEIERVIQILSRRKKNNPVLIGEPGVGKTAIVEGIAQKIASGDIPDLLSGKRVLILDLASIVAGTKYRGEFEERLKNIIKEIKKVNNIILFIDELHTLIGAGGAEGAIDAANMLKPALARGEIQCIGATTLNEYKKYIERDVALERRFQPILVKEPSLEETIRILMGLKESYENFHKVNYSRESIISAASLAQRYINDRYLPDKAIDLIDEAGARARLKNSTRPKEFSDIDRKINDLTLAKDESVKNQDYEKAAEMRDKVNELKKKLEQMTNEWKKHLVSDVTSVSSEDISAVISFSTGIPISKISQNESQKLLKMEEELHKRVIGQEEAISAISHAIRRSRTGLKSKKRPIGSFIFLGPTGVGKTEMSKALAEFLFGNEDALIRIDMSEFMERHSVSRLIGSPPGYIGYEEGGDLTEKIRRRPYSVILLDEIEKAHPDVFNILLQILEEGQLSDNLGHIVNFRNSVVIMTSNIGAREISKGVYLGFSDYEGSKKDFNDLKNKVMGELNRIFNPEFLNRMDETIVFHPLSQEDIRKIVDILLKELHLLLLDKEISLNIGEDVKDFLAKKGFNRKFGARPLRRTIQKMLEDNLSNGLLLKKYKSGDRLKVVIKDEKLDLIKEINYKKKDNIKI